MSYDGYGRLQSKHVPEQDASTRADAGIAPPLIEPTEPDENNDSRYPIPALAMRIIQ
jgi:hypothetical protein